MLEVKNICKYYGGTMAIDNISFSAGENEIIGLVGHNGSGKSTTMNIITGCLAPSSGSVTINGIPINSDPVAARRQTGYLPEIPPVYPDMTVEEQLKFACRLRSIPKNETEKEISDACEGLNITGVRKRLIRNLSKGYRQRVGFAQALIGKPPLLVLDEPTVGLDPQQIMELREFISQLKSSHTVILSSHILSEIAATCDRLVVLSSGRLAADDTISGLSGKASEQEGILLRADGPTDRIISVVTGLSGVISCVPEKDGTVKIRTEGGADIHRELFKALSEANMPISMLTPVSVSLEDIFMQLTHDERYTKTGERTE